MGTMYGYPMVNVRSCPGRRASDTLVICRNQGNVEYEFQRE